MSSNSPRALGGKRCPQLRLCLGLLVNFLFTMSLVGCGSGGGSSDAASAADPSLVTSPSGGGSGSGGSGGTTYDPSGNYAYKKASGTYAPCPNCIMTCDNSGGSWTCGYQSYQPPAACTMSLIGGFRIDPTGTMADTFSFMVTGHGVWMGTPSVNWSAQPSAQAITVSNDTVTLTAQNFSFDLIQDGTSIAVVQFATGCAIAFNKTAFTNL